MKSVARSYMWWPALESDIELLGKRCSPFQLERPNPPKGRLNVWSYPDGPWERVHEDYLGPWRNEQVLLITDAYSRWPEMAEVALTSADSGVKQ